MLLGSLSEDGFQWVYFGPYTIYYIEIYNRQYPVCYISQIYTYFCRLTEKLGWKKEISGHLVNFAAQGKIAIPISQQMFHLTSSYRPSGQIPQIHLTFYCSSALSALVKCLFSYLIRVSPFLQSSLPVPPTLDTEQKSSSAFSF